MDSSYADLSGFTMCATQKENDVPAAAVKTGETKTANTVTVVAGGSGALEENPISLDDYMEETFITLNENSAFGRISADENVVVGEMEKSVAEEVHEDIMLTTEDQNGSRSGTGGNDVGDDAQVWQHWTPVLFVDWEVPSNPQCCDTKDEAKCSAPKKSKMEQNRDYHANQRRKKELLQFNIKSLLETDMEYKRLMLEYCKTLQQCDCILPELRTVLFQKANEFYSPEDMMRVPDMNAKPGGRAPRQPFSKERKNLRDRQRRLDEKAKMKALQESCEHFTQKKNLMYRFIALLMYYVERCGCYEKLCDQTINGSHPRQSDSPGDCQ